MADAISPPTTGFVDRPRLYRLLDRPHPPVTLIVGPSGIGKTSLLRGWLQQRADTSPLTWITVNEGPSDQHSFWQSVIDAARRHRHLSSETSRQLTEQLGLTADPVRIAIDLLSSAGALTLVLDAYEHLGDLEQRIDDDLLRLVGALPDLRLLITTRGGSALAHRTLQARGTTRVLADRDLAFTTEEIHALVVAELGEENPRLAASLARATQGYALAVRAAVLALGTLSDLPPIDSPQWQAVVASDLESLLPDAATVEFVIATSVPPYFDAELAERMATHPDVPSALRFLERNGFGRWIPYAQDKPVFQYVESIRGSFRIRAAATPTDFTRWSDQAAGWLLAHEDLDQAFLLALDGQNHRLAERVLLRLLATTPESHTTDRFLGPLRLLPSTVLDQHPLLRFGLAAAMTSNPGMHTEALSHFRQLADSTVTSVQVDPAFDALIAAMVRTIALRLSLRFRDSARVGTTALELVEAIPAGLCETFGDYIGSALRHISFSLLLGGELEDASRMMRRSAAICVTPTTRAHSLIYLAGAAAFAGDLAQATAIYRGIDAEAWPEELQHSVMNAFGLVAEAYIRLERLDFNGVLEALDEGSSYVRVTTLWPLLAGLSAQARLGLGQSRAEAERLTSALAEGRPGTGDNVASESLTGLLTMLWLAAGEPEHAQAVLADVPKESPSVAPARLAVLLEAGRAGAAFHEAPGLLDLAGHTIRTQAATQTLAAVAALRQQETSLALRFLDGAAIAYASHGVRSHLAFLDNDDHQLLLRFANHVASPSLDAYLHAGIPRWRTNRCSAPPLTARELEVLQALTEHDSTREIATALFVSPNTVKSQLQALYRKLGVSSRAAAVEVGRELGLLG